MKLDQAALDAHPLPPIVDGDKETKGRLLVIAGSEQLPGAPLLVATAAMRAGAGKLRIATAEKIAVQVGLAVPEAKAIGLPDGVGAVEAITEEAAGVVAVIAGPGMMDGKTCRQIGDALLRSKATLALDAAILESLEPLKYGRKSTPVLLPHAGELASLLDCDEEEVTCDPIAAGHRAAQLYGSIVLIKGVTSHVVTPDGDFWTYDGGAPGLGISGSGDVLAGIVGGLLARGSKPLNALLWAVWLHGEAGAALAKKVGPIGFLAREIADEIPALLPR